MGLELLRQVVRHVREHEEVPARKQDERFATRAPLIRRSVMLAEERAAPTTSLMVTVIGPDRPGIVRLLSDRARGFGANWAASRMASLDDQFAGIVHLLVPPENAEPLSAALRGLESAGLQVQIARTDSGPVPPGRRMVRLELVGADRPGIVSDLSASLAERGASIEDLHTEIVRGGEAGEHMFKVKALLYVPNALSDDALRSGLDKLAHEMKMDLALGEVPGVAVTA
jgi:glycine cleavage system regulatory protein